MTHLPPNPERLARARQLMAAAAIDLLVIGPSADFRYFTGRPGHLSERLTALVIEQDGPPVLVVPKLEAPLYADLEGVFQLIAWADGEDPIAHLVALAQSTGSRAIAVNDQFWSGFLLQLQDRLPERSFRRASPLLRRLRMTKDAEELALLREASRRTDAAWEYFCAHERLTGRTEREVAARLTELLLAEGLHEVAFCIVASGPNGASPHHETGDRVIQPGDPVVIDFGGSYYGYYSDITRTPVAGEPPPEFAGAYEAVLEAQQAAFAAIRPGVPCQDVDRAARQILAERGYGPYFIHRLGHGVGLTVHEDPYLVEGNDEPLEPGMVVSDEPGVYIPGQWGVRIEDLVVVTEDGAERLNTVSHELLRLP
jgi:Xaa-Pro aminopeptidase